MANKRDVIRPSWQEYFALSTLITSLRSSCWYVPTGAVIVRDKRIISTGYNGAPSNVRNCLELSCRKDERKIEQEVKNTGNCRGEHAERNAIIQIARKDLEGTTMYSLLYPCSDCAKLIVGSGIKEVFYMKMYKEPDSLTNELFQETGIALRKMDLDIDKYFKIAKKIYNYYDN